MPLLRSSSRFWFVIAAGLLLPVAVAAQAPVGRIAAASGPVSLRPPGGGWAVVARGAALSEGQSLRAGPRSQVELDLGLNRIGLDPGTVLRIDSAHPATPAVTLEQGRAMLLLRSLQAGQVARVVMPRGSVTLAAPGLYVIEVDAAYATVGVSRGMAQVYGAGVSMMVSAGQTGVIGGPDGRPASLRAGVADGFLADDASMPAMPQVVRPALAPPLPGSPFDDVVELPGGAALLRDGSWASNPDYGPVWYPPVAPGWSPYADPWDDGGRWGYTPWHYGSWIQIGPRWGWLPPPRRYYDPGYAHRSGRPPPALAQPQRLPPRFLQPQGYDSGGRPPGPPVVQGAPGIFGPRPAPVAGPPPVLPPPIFAPRPAPAPVAGPAPVAPPSIFAPRPAPSAPVAGPPPIFAPRPSPPPPMAAPAPSRRCGPFQTPC